MNVTKRKDKRENRNMNRISDAMPLIVLNTNGDQNGNEKTEELSHEQPVVHFKQQKEIVHRKGTSPFSADLKYRNRILSRKPLKVHDHLMQNVTSDNVQGVKRIFSEKSVGEQIESLRMIRESNNKYCIQMAIDFRSLKCLQYFLELLSSLETESKEMGIDMSECFYTSRHENVFHTLATRQFDHHILDVLAANEKTEVLINNLDIDGNSPLLISTKRGNFEMGEYLVKHGAMIDSLNKNGESPIGICIANNESRLFRCFIEHVHGDKLDNVMQNQELYGGHTVLFPLLASKSGSCTDCYPILQEVIPASLLRTCFQREIQNIEFLKMCCSSCSELKIMDTVMELLSDFAIVKDDNGTTPLMWAAAGGNGLLISKILSSPSWRKAILATDNNGKTFIHHGIHSNCLELISKEVLEKLSHSEEFLLILNKKDMKDYTPLHYAVSEGYIEVFSTLTSLGASPDVLGPAPYFRSLLHYAVYSDETTVDGLLENVRKEDGEDAMVALINEGDYRKETAMHLAARSGHTEIVFCLLSKKASIKSDYKDRTPLHSAAEGGSEDVISILLEFKPDIIDEKDNLERTALMVAAEEGHADVVKLLLSHDAKITKDVKGNSCLDYAVDNNWPEVALVIINREPPIWREALEQSNNGHQHIMSKMVQKMDAVACSILDKCITSEGNDKLDAKKINYDFFLLKKPHTAGVSPFLNSLVEYNSYNCLNHPIMIKFLTLSWRCPRVRGMYYASFSIYLLFILSFTSYIWITRDDIECSANGTNNRHVNATCNNPIGSFNCYCKSGFSGNATHCQGSVNWKSPGLLALTGICVTISIMSLIIEVGQFIKGRMRYIKEWANYIEITLYISTMIFIIPAWSEKTSVQWHAGAIGIFLAWIKFIWFLKFFASFGIYIIMAKRVILTVLKVFPLTFPFLVAFGMANFVLFPRDEGFTSVPLSVFLSLVMMTGELDFRDVFLQQTCDSFFIIRLIILTLFLLLISIAMMNLFTGLAVGDTNEVLENAEEERRWQQADYILTLEKLCPVPTYNALTSYTEYPNKRESDEIEFAEFEEIHRKQKSRYSSILYDLEKWIITNDKERGNGQSDTIESRGVDRRVSVSTEAGLVKSSAILDELLQNSREIEKRFNLATQNMEAKHEELTATFMSEMKAMVGSFNETVNRLESRLNEIQEK